MRRKDGSTFLTENLVTAIRGDDYEPVAGLSIAHGLSSLQAS